MSFDGDLKTYGKHCARKLITGGTGSFGNTVLNRFLNTDISEICIFSCDERMQDDMRHEFQEKMSEVADKILFILEMTAIYKLLRTPCTIWITFSIQ